MRYLWNDKGTLRLKSGIVQPGAEFDVEPGEIDDPGILAKCVPVQAEVAQPEEPEQSDDDPPKKRGRKKR